MWAYGVSSIISGCCGSRSNFPQIADTASLSGADPLAEKGVSDGIGGGALKEGGGEVGGL